MQWRLRSSQFISALALCSVYTQAFTTHLSFSSRTWALFSTNPTTNNNNNNNNSPSRRSPTASTAAATPGSTFRNNRPPFGSTTPRRKPGSPGSKNKPIVDPNRPPLNDEIKFSTLRVMITGKVTDINKIPKDEPLGIMTKAEALARAKDMGNLDLILINDNSDPPVAKIADYSKYRYEKEKKAKEVKKNNKSTELKEIKMSYSIDTHDYQVRVKNASKFMMQGNRVKCSILFKGREIQHDALGYQLLQQMADDLKKICVMEGKPKREGKTLSCILTPKPDVIKAANDKKRAEEKAKKKKKEELKKSLAVTGEPDDDDDEENEDDEDSLDEDDDEDEEEEEDESNDSILLNLKEDDEDDEDDIDIDEDISLDELLKTDKVTGDLFN